jgi:hypothetical protein
MLACLFLVISQEEQYGRLKNTGKRVDCHVAPPPMHRVHAIQKIKARVAAGRTLLSRVTLNLQRTRLSVDEFYGCDA